VTQIIEHLLCKSKPMSSNPSHTIKEKSSTELLISPLSSTTQYSRSSNNSDKEHNKRRRFYFLWGEIVYDETPLERLSLKCLWNM
jgi:hypothetical protein